MVLTRSQHFAVALLTVLVLSFSAGCGDDDNSNHDTNHNNSSENVDFDEFEQGMVKGSENGEFTVVLRNEIDGSEHDLVQGVNNLIFEVTDAEGGGAVEEAELTVEPNMPAHDDGCQCDISIEETEPGIYRAENVDLFMTGHWHIDVEIDDGETTDTVGYDFDVEGEEGHTH